MSQKIASTAISGSLRARSDSSRRERLRVALLINSYVQPRWVSRIIREIASSSVAEIAAVVMFEDDEGPCRTYCERVRALLESSNGALFKMYAALDAAVFDAPPHAFREDNIHNIVFDCPLLRVKTLRDSDRISVSPQELAKVEQHHPDVALYFGSQSLGGAALGIARYGVWKYDHADHVLYHGGPPGFWELMERNLTTGAVLQVLDEAGGRVIYRSLGLTDHWSLRRSLNHSYWQSSSFVMRVLGVLHKRGPSALTEACQSLPDKSYSRPPHSAPGNLEVTALLIRFAARYCRRKLRHLFYFDQWIIAYKFEDAFDSLGRNFRDFRLLVPPKDRFWADPFAVQKGDSYFIFFEELPYATGRGRLCCVEVFPNGNIGQPTVVLERPYHLSYPFVFQWGGQHYMIPETSQARTIEMYRCNSFPGNWALETVLFRDINAVDTTLAEIDGRWWMFVSVGVEGVRDGFELNLFYAPSPLGPWTAHANNPVKADIGARPAGKLVCRNGEWYRPSQSAYGQSMSFHKILRLDPDVFLETEVARILPDWTEHLNGTHTFDTEGGLTVIDGLRRRRRHGG